MPPHAPIIRWKLHKGTPEKLVIFPAVTGAEEAGIDFDLKGTHEIELADGMKTRVFRGRTEESVKERNA